MHIITTPIVSKNMIFLENGSLLEGNQKINN